MALIDWQAKKVFVHENENEEDAFAALYVAKAMGHSEKDFTVVYEGRSPSDEQIPFLF